MKGPRTSTGAKLRMGATLPVYLLEERLILPEFIVVIVLRPACAIL